MAKKSTKNSKPSDPVKKATGYGKTLAEIKAEAEALKPKQGIDMITS